MRWSIFFVAALFGAFISASSVAFADGKGTTIKVTVLDPEGKPVEGLHVVVSTTLLADRIAIGETDKDGSLQTARDRNGKALGADVYSVHAYDGNGNEWHTTVYAGAGKAEVTLSGAAHWKVVQGEAAGLRQDIALQERQAAETGSAAGAFARDQNLRATDLAGAKKDLQRLESLPKELQDEALKSALNRYIRTLEFIEYQRNQIIPEAKKRLAELESAPPAEQGHVMNLPSTCPEGESGGLLAGVINSATGSDLQGVCGEEAQRRRDTDRPAGSRHDKHDERD